MKKPIVKKNIAKVIKKIRPFAGPIAIGAAGVSAVVALDARKKSKRKKIAKIGAEKEYAFREGMRATLDLKSAGASNKQIRKMSKEYIGLDFSGKRKKGYSDKEAGFQLIAKDRPRQVARNIKGLPTKNNKYIIYDL
mgnify:CR=1 FL=1